jgi:hypothetical protein
MERIGGRDPAADLMEQIDIGLAAHLELALGKM